MRRLFPFHHLLPGSAIDRASGPEACAVQDLYVFSIIEEVGATQLVKGEALFKASVLGVARISDQGRAARRRVLASSLPR